jgi:DNA-binding Lrp family transcriptional regulator
MAARHLDEIDERLLALLVRNARESTTNLAKRVGLSRPAVHDRILRLERDGFIHGYSAITPREASRSTLRAQVLIALEPRHQERILEAMTGLGEVRRLMTVSGEYDLVAEVAVQDSGELDRLLTRIGRIPGIARTVTLVVLTASLDRDRPPAGR